MTVRVDESLDGIDRHQPKADLVADDFDNGRSPQASFAQSQHVAIARILLRHPWTRGQPVFMSAIVGT